MTCEDCIHSRVCKFYDDNAFLCSQFQNRTDFVNVIICKDCKWFCHYGRTSLLINGKNVKAGWCMLRAKNDEEHRMTADDYCSYGKRKDEDDGLQQN